MLFEITPQKEKKIREWQKQHTFENHFEFSLDEQISIETDSLPYTYLIYPSRKNPEKYLGLVRCNFCSEVFQFSSKNEIDINQRQTGRTTRMLEQAIKLSKEGHKVAIIAATEEHKKIIQNQFMSLGGSLDNVKFYNGADPKINEKMRGTSYSEIFNDHYAIETGREYLDKKNII